MFQNFPIKLKKGEKGEAKAHSSFDELAAGIFSGRTDFLGKFSREKCQFLNLIRRIMLILSQISP